MTTTTQDALRARMPGFPGLVPAAGEIAAALNKAAGNGSVPQTTLSLIALRAGNIVGSTYIVLRNTNALRAAGESEERIAAVMSWRDAPYFTDAERAALELLEAVLQPNPDGERVPDELFARVQAHYDERAFATLIAAIGQVFFFIPVALIGKPIPGVGLKEQWR